VTATRPGSQVGVQIRRGNGPTRIVDVVIGRAPNSYAWLPRELEPTFPAETAAPGLESPNAIPATGHKGESPKINRQKKP